jgi:hypothetical protein
MRSGHALNRRVLEALFAAPDAWCWTTMGAGPVAASAWVPPPLRASA